MNAIENIVQSLAGQDRAALANLITAAPLMQPHEVPAAAMPRPAGRHLVELLPLLPAGPGLQLVPALVEVLTAAEQSSEGTAAGSNDAAELLPVRQSFAQIVATVPASREILSDSALVGAMLDGELREALRAKSDTVLAAQLAKHAPIFTPPSSSDAVTGIVGALLAFGKRWGAARAVVVDHTKIDAQTLLSHASGAVAWADGGGLSIAGVPVVLASLDNPAEAIIAAGAVLDRQGESVLSLEEITTGKVTLRATARLAAIGPALRVAI